MFFQWKSSRNLSNFVSKQVSCTCGLLNKIRGRRVIAFTLYIHTNERIFKKKKEKLNQIAKFSVVTNRKPKTSFQLQNYIYQVKERETNLQIIYTLIVTEQGFSIMMSLDYNIIIKCLVIIIYKRITSFAMYI